jgi:hypothetical protein
MSTLRFIQFTRCGRPNVLFTASCNLTTGEIMINNHTTNVISRMQLQGRNTDFADLFITYINSIRNTIGTYEEHAETSIVIDPSVRVYSAFFKNELIEFNSTYRGNRNRRYFIFLDFTFTENEMANDPFAVSEKTESIRNLDFCGDASIYTDPLQDNVYEIRFYDRDTMTLIESYDY